MSWRVVVISRRAKLDYKMWQLVMRTDTETKRVHIDEISVLIIEDTSVSVTAYLLSELISKKVKVIFCDTKRNPSSELVSYNGSYDCSAKIRNQIKWTDDIKFSIWTEIVTDKIRKQSEFLRELGKKEESELLNNYISEMKFNDENNREGHAAKVYFNAIFGKNFTRSNDCVINAALNYGYSIILSAFNRECSVNGYITQLGLFHNNMFNFFNLSCDLMEPFRVIVDRNVVKNKYTEFVTEEKYSLINILNETVYINNTEQYVINAIRIYCRSIFEAINTNDVSAIKLYSIMEVGSEL